MAKAPRSPPCPTCIRSTRARRAALQQPGPQHGEGLHVEPLVLRETLARGQHREEVCGHGPIHLGDRAWLQGTREVSKHSRVKNSQGALVGCENTGTWAATWPCSRSPPARPKTPHSIMGTTRAKGRTQAPRPQRPSGDRRGHPGTRAVVPQEELTAARRWPQDRAAHAPAAPETHLPGSGRGEEAPGGVGRPLLDAGVAEPVPQPLAECLGLLWGDTMGTELSVWGFLGPSSGPGGPPCPPADTVLTFRKGVRGQAGDLGHDREEVRQAGPLRLPTLQDLDDALAHGPDLLRVALQNPWRNVNTNSPHKHHSAQNITRAGPAQPARSWGAHGGWITEPRATRGGLGSRGSHVTWAKSTEATKPSCRELWAWSQDRLRLSEGAISLSTAAQSSWSRSGQRGEQRVVCSSATHVGSSLGGRGRSASAGPGRPPGGRGGAHLLLYLVAATMRKSLRRASRASGPQSSACSSALMRAQNLPSSSAPTSLQRDHHVGNGKGRPVGGRPSRAEEPEASRDEPLPGTRPRSLPPPLLAGDPQATSVHSKPPHTQGLLFQDQKNKPLGLGVKTKGDFSLNQVAFQKILLTSGNKS